MSPVCIIRLHIIGLLLRVMHVGASVTLMFYEHALCLAQEVSLVWLGKWSTLQAAMMADIYVREAGMLFIALGDELS